MDNPTIQLCPLPPQRGAPFVDHHPSVLMHKGTTVDGQRNYHALSMIAYHNLSVVIDKWTTPAWWPLCPLVSHASFILVPTRNN